MQFVFLCFELLLRLVVNFYEYLNSTNTNTAYINWMPVQALDGARNPC